MFEPIYFMVDIKIDIGAIGRVSFITFKYIAYGA